MKIYLDNNLGLTNVEQEELTQDTIGYNILKVYIPNAVLTPYDTFTCYYGALLQNGRKVGWFAMEARTSSDADYEEGYTLYKATLEQCVVSVEGKVYIGCQVLLGNSGNATLIKKNTAVVQFNVRKSVAINNDILILDTDQTTTDVLESYKNLLENALTTYATKATTYTKTEVDSALSLKVNKADIADDLTTNNSNKVLSAKQGYILKGMLDALEIAKQDVLTFDSTPTENSTNPVTSGGVKTALVQKQDNYLFNKKYVACGDSFTKGDVISSDKVYPYLIAQRNNMRLVNMAHNGSYCHYGADGFTNPNNSYYYQNIPLDADIITIAYGLNETSTTIGTKDSNDNTTIWGAYNEVLGWITTNIPNAKVGIISNDAWMTYELRNALQEIASYWGVEFLDLKEYGKPFMISGKYNQDGDTNPSVVSQRTTQYCVSSQNGHPNELGHKVRSYIVENFLRGAYGVDNSYTRKEVETKLNTKANASTTYTKTEVDNALSLKADKTDVYTKTEVDQKINDLRWELGSHTLDVESDTDVAFSKSVPNYAIGCQINKIGGMSYKVEVDGVNVIRDSAVTSVVSKDRNSDTVATLNIPSEIQALNGYGWGINDTCYNYIDFANKKFVQKVGRVDLGTLNWTYASNNRFYTTITDIKVTLDSEVYNAICNEYTIVSRNNVTNANKSISLSKVSASSDGYINVYDTAYTDVQTFKSAMSGIYLYYELATPIENDISQYLTTDTIDVEPLGTIEFTNTYSQDVPSDIDYLIEEVKA